MLFTMPGYSGVAGVVTSVEATTLYAKVTITVPPSEVSGEAEVAVYATAQTSANQGTFEFSYYGLNPLITSVEPSDGLMLGGLQP